MESVPGMRFIGREKIKICYREVAANMFKIFGKHYGTERFFILLFVLFGLIISLFIYAGTIQHKRNQFSLGSTPLYTSNYRWSRTSAEGNVVKMLSNSRNTGVFLLIKNENVSMTSTNADDYEVFLTGANEPMTNNPSMTIYSFGLTGYVGFYFTDAKGFSNQLCKMIIRANSAGSDAADESMFDYSIRDSSFRDNNQIQIYLNFGASGIQKLPIMDEPGLTPMKIMCDAGIDLASLGITGDAKSFKTLQSTAQRQLNKMNKSLIAIAQYRSTLQEQNVEVPDMPYYIANDYVDTNPVDFNTMPTTFELDMLASGATGSSGTRFTGQTVKTEESEGNAAPVNTEKTWTDEDGTTYEYRYLHTKYLYPGTANVQWQGMRLSDGLITQTRFYTGDGQGLDEAYELFHAWSEDCEEDYKEEMPTKVKYDSWRKLDGTYVNMSTSDPLEQQIVSMINKYVNEVNNYMATKQKYLETQVSMLETEAAVQGLRKLIYSNNGSKMQNLWLY